MNAIPSNQPQAPPGATTTQATSTPAQLSFGGFGVPASTGASMFGAVKPTSATMPLQTTQLTGRAYFYLICLFETCSLNTLVLLSRFTDILDFRSCPPGIRLLTWFAIFHPSRARYLGLTAATTTQQTGSLTLGGLTASQATTTAPAMQPSAFTISGMRYVPSS